MIGFPITFSDNVCSENTSLLARICEVVVPQRGRGDHPSPNFMIVATNRHWCSLIPRLAIPVPCVRVMAWYNILRVAVFY